MINSAYDSINNFFSLENLLSFLLLIGLTLLGVGARISIDIEILKKPLKGVNFFPRYFLALVLSYVVELYLAEHEDSRKYYAEIIILFCIFVNDLIRFVLTNTNKIIMYMLGAFTKGVMDLRRFFVNTDNKNDNN